MMGVASPVENDGAFCFFGVCLNYLFKGNWTPFSEWGEK